MSCLQGVLAARFRLAKIAVFHIHSTARAHTLVHGTRGPFVAAKRCSDPAQISPKTSAILDVSRKLQAGQAADSQHPSDTTIQD